MNKTKEERFEKVVEWGGPDGFEIGLFFTLIIPALLFLWVGFFAKDWDLILFVNILYSIFFIIGIISVIDKSRKVYWRKVNR